MRLFVTINDFAVHINLVDLTELEKVMYLSYYELKRNNKLRFDTEDILKWFNNLLLPSPNMTRLRNKIVKSRDFVKDGESCFKLHIKTIKWLDEKYHDALSINKPAIKTGAKEYIHLDRITQLEQLTSTRYDLIKLIQNCRELNYAHLNNCYLSIISLTRMLIDHIPPIFGFNTFAEIANNYSGSKSFKDSMKHLENSSRKIADQYLHSHIRAKEVLPNINQVDFSNDIDVLLSEIIRILK